MILVLNYYSKGMYKTIWTTGSVSLAGFPMRMNSVEKKQVFSACMRLSLDIMLSSGFVLAPFVLFMTFICRLT